MSTYVELCEELRARGLHPELDVHPDRDVNDIIIGPAAWCMSASDASGRLAGRGDWIRGLDAAASSLVRSMKRGRIQTDDDDARDDS